MKFLSIVVGAACGDEEVSYVSYVNNVMIHTCLKSPLFFHTLLLYDFSAV